MPASQWARSEAPTRPPKNKWSKNSWSAAGWFGPASLHVVRRVRDNAGHLFISRGLLGGTWVLLHANLLIERSRGEVGQQVHGPPRIQARNAAWLGSASQSNQ